MAVGSNSSLSAEDMSEVRVSLSRHLSYRVGTKSHIPEHWSGLSS